MVSGEEAAGTSQALPLSPPGLPRLPWIRWSERGREWVEEFERCNPLMKSEDLVLEPETLQDIDNAFNEVGPDILAHKGKGLGHESMPLSCSDGGNLHRWMA